jgi:pSer/pThr/pTyr-binding forkhead associated (FHA) protein
MTIGRKDDNDIRIDNLAVSGHHAKLLTIFDDSFLEDLDSTNGTYVNGRPITKHPLKNGDVIVIGKHELRYINESSAAKLNNHDVIEINKLKIEYYIAI